MPNDIKRARAVRSARAEILGELRDGSRSLRTTLRWPPKPLHRCTVYTVIVASYNMGPTGAAKVLKQSNVGPLETLEVLSLKDRKTIIKQLPKRAT